MLIATPNPTAASSFAPSDSSVVPGLVLVVDDTASQRYAVARALRAEGFEVIEAATGMDALKAARLSPPDAVVLDVELPDLDGFDVCRRLKAASTTLLPVLHLSSSKTSSAARVKGLDAGADGYLTHPFDPDELRAAVSALVRLKRQEAERAASAAVNSLLHDALDTLADHVALLGPDGDVIAVNRAWAEFATANGYDGGGTGLGTNYCRTCERAIGTDADEARAAAMGIRRVLASELETFGLEYPCHSPAAERWFRMTVRRVAHPGLVAAIVIHTDRTEERAAARAESAARARANEAHAARAREEALFRALTEQSVEFVSILDVDGHFIYVSPSVERTLGYRAQELLGSFPSALVHPDDRATMLATHRALVEGSDGARAEMLVRLRHKDGSWRHFEGGGQNLLHQPDIRGITSNARDVTSRVMAESARQESETRFRRFVETAHEGVIATDSIGVITYANPRIGVLLGVVASDLLGRAIFDLMPPADAFLARNTFARRQLGLRDVVETGLRVGVETAIDARVAASPIFGDQGEFVGELAVITDITEQKRAAQDTADALRAADLDRRRLEATLEAIPVGVWLADANGALTHVNAAAVQLWGGHAPLVPAREKHSVYRVFRPGATEPISSEEMVLARTLATGVPILNETLEVERIDGTRGHHIYSAAPILDDERHLTGGVVVGVDISARQEAARERDRLLAAVETERSRLAAIFEQAPAFLAVLRGPDHIFERVNPAYLELVGDRDLIGRPVLDALPELRGQGIIELLNAVRASGEPILLQHAPAQFARVPGGGLETRYRDIVYQRLIDDDGDIAVVVHGVDVTDVVLAQESLRRTEQQLREQFHKLPVPTFLWERRADRFILVDCNELACLMLPDTRDAMLGRSGSEIFPGWDDLGDDCRRSLRENVVIVRSSKADSGAGLSHRSLDLTIGPQQPDRVLIHVVDTTDRRELESQLRQSQKMDAVGRLAGGVAHDFNNLLTVIGAHSSFLLDSLDSSDPQREDALAIHSAGVRAAGLTRQLLAFSRKQLLKPTRLDLNVIVSESVTMLKRLIGEDIEIAMNLASDLGAVIADATQMDQVIVNLAVNARDAMPHGGRLDLTTRNVALTGTMPESHGVIPDGRYTLLEIRDTGIGMDATVQARLFEPFYTTKEVGKGTGLGLATVYGIVKQTGGYILVESIVGVGSAFLMYLPVAEANDGGDQQRVAEGLSVRGVETVLIIEDEEAVRSIATRVLKRQGYNVLTAASGAEALAISEAFAAPIHLVVSDAVMPGMGGAEVVRRLRAERATVKVLFMSGYTDDDVVRRGIVSADVPFVQKPFTPAELSRAVRKTLDL